MTTQETWRPVVGYEGLYEVSDLGRVRSLTARARWAAGRILAPALAGKGYRYVRLCDGETQRAAYVAVLVLTAFIGPRPAGMQAAHADADTDNNALSNLSWKTPTENAADKLRTGTQPLGSAHHNSKLTESDVRDIRADRRSSTILAAQYGVTPSLIVQLRAGKGWAHV